MWLFCIVIKVTNYKFCSTIKWMNCKMCIGNMKNNTIKKIKKNLKFYFIVWRNFDWKCNKENHNCISGGLFHPGDDNQEIAFRYAVDKINTDKSILPRSKLTAQVEIISPQDSFHASKRGDLFTLFSWIRLRYM